MQRRPYWFILNIYGWIVLLMSIVTAILVAQEWIVLLGVIGYLIALLADLIGGGSLGRTGAVRLAKAEQENRELRAEQARLTGAIRERDAKLASFRLIDHMEQVVPEEKQDAKNSKDAGDPADPADHGKNI